MLPLPYPNLINSFLEISHSTQFIKLFLKQLITRGSVSTDPYFSQFLTSVLKIIYSNPEVFNQEDAENIVLQISTYIIQYQPPALALFGAISIFISDNLLNSMVYSMVSCIKEIILQDPLIKIEISPDEETNLKSVKISDALKKPTIDLEFPEAETFQNDFSNRNDNFPECDKLSNFIGTKASEYLSLIADSFYNNQKLSSLFINIFLTSIKSSNQSNPNDDQSATKNDDQNQYKNNDCLNLISGVFLLQEKIFNLGVKTTINFNSIQFLAPIYDPNFSLYDFTKELNDANQTVNHKYYHIFNTLRQKALEIASQANVNSFYSIIGITSPYPLLMDEVVVYIMANPDDFFDKIGANPAVIRVLLRISYHYQTANFRQTETGIIEIVRSRIIQFFTFFCNQRSTIVNSFIFNDQESTEIFVSFAREKKLEPFVLQTITQYGSGGGSKDVTTLINCVFKAIKFYALSYECKKKERVISLLTSLINFVNLISIHRIKYQSGLIPEICELICSLLSQLEAKSEVQNLIRESVMFVTAMTKNSFIIDGDACQCFVSILNRFKKVDIEFVNSIFVNLVQFLGGEFMSTISSTFIVQQPQVVKLLIQVYLDTSKFSDVSNLIISLCHFSTKNIQICYKNQIDLFILKCIEEARLLNSYDESTVKSLLSLFFIISSYKTDVKTVLKYISLYKPIDENHHVSKYQPLFLDTMKTVIDESLKGPLKYLPLNGEIVTSNQTEFPGIESGFTFTTWIYVEQNGPDYQPNLFTLFIGKAFKITLSLSANVCLSTIDDSNKEVTGKMMEPLPIGQWTFFAYSITLKPEGIAQVVFRINLDEAGSFKVQNLAFDFTNARPTFSIGGGTVSSSFNHDKIASSSFSPLLTDDQLRSVFENGICRYEPQFSFLVYDFFLSFSPHGVYSITSFIRKLIKQCSINIFFPLLNDSVVLFPDGSPFSLQFDLTLQLICSFLPFSIDLQKSFCDNSGPAILGHLIKTRWLSQFTYKTYVMFYQLLEIIKFDDLQLNLFRYILVNFDILCLIEGEFHMRILRHWEQTLYLTFGTLSKSVYDLSFLLTTLRLYYWYEPIDDQCFYRGRRKEFNIDYCRKRIQNVILKYIEEDGLKSSDFFLLLSNITDCRDVKQSIDLSNFLLTVIYSYNERFDFKVDSSDLLPYLAAFFLTKNNDVNVLAVSVLTALKSNNLISDKYLLDFIGGMTLILPKDKSYPFFELFASCFDELKSCSSLYPLCCILALNLNDKEPLNKLINDLKFEYGFVWPCTLTVTSTVDQKKEIFKFLVKNSDEKRLLDVFIFFDLLFLDQKSNEETKGVFITVLGELIVDEKLTSLLNFFFRFSEFFILFRKDKFLKESSDFSYYEWNRTMLKIKQEKLVYKFGLRVDSSGNWKDFDLAKKVISIFNEFEGTEKKSFVLLLSAYCSQFSKNSEEYSIQLNESDKNAIDSLLEANGNSYENYFVSLYGIKDNSKIDDHIRIQYSDFFNRYSNISIKFNTHAQHREKMALNKMTPDFEKIGLSSQSKLNWLSKIQTISIDEQKKSWDSLWFHLSSHCGPWENCSRNDLVLNRFVRDTNSCFSLVPIKLSQSFQFLNYETNLRRNSSEILIELECQILTFDDTVESTFELTNDSVLFRIQTLRSFVFSLSSVTFIGVNKGRSTLQLFAVTGANMCAKFRRDDLETVCGFLEKLKSEAKLKNLVLFLNEEPFKLFNSDSFKKLCIKRWSMRKISNYEYLCVLNFLDGRSFNSPERYPVFPCLFNGAGKMRKDLSKTVFGTSKYTDDMLPISKETVFRYFEKFTEKSSASSLDKLKPLEESGEAVPEIYSMTELSSPDIAYANRKVLESDEVTANLHKWISLIWSSESANSISPENGFVPLFQGSHASRSKSKTWSFLSRKIGAVSVIQDGEIDESEIWSSSCSAMIKETAPREYVVAMLILQNVGQIKQQQQLGVYVEVTVVNESRKSFKMKNVSVPLPNFSPSNSLAKNDSSSSSLLSESASSSVSAMLSSSQPSTTASASSSANNSSANITPLGSVDGYGENEANINTSAILYADGLCQFLITSSYRTGDENLESDSMSTVSALDIISLSKKDLSEHRRDDAFWHLHDVLKQNQRQSQQQQQHQQPLPHHQQLLQPKRFLQEKKSKEKQQSHLMLKRKTVKITAVSTDGPFVVVGFDSSMVTVFVKWKQIFRILLYRGSITALAVSETSHIFVASMDDNSIAICSLVSGTVVKLIDLSSKIPKKILISPSWGFINVYCSENKNGSVTNFLNMYNVNGQFIRSTEIDFQVDFWYAWKSYCGFDFLAIADVNGSIYCCENFYINSVQKLLSTNGNIIAFYYSNETSTLVATLSNGQLFMIPFTA